MTDASSPCQQLINCTKICRSRKSVARWSPDDLASPTGYGTPKTPKTVAEKVWRLGHDMNCSKGLANALLTYASNVTMAGGL